MVGTSLGGTYPATHIMDGEYIKFHYPLGLSTVYKFRSNFDLCLTGYPRQILPGVITYGF